MFKSKELQELQERGIVKDIINPQLLDEKFAKGEKICLYCGFDLTADSLHVGNLVPIRVLQILHRYGHKIIVLFGGATTKIGDPSGKDTQRSMKTDEEIEQNKIGIIKSVSNFINIDENVVFLNNNDWIGGMNYINFLRDVGAYFSVNRMLTMESVKIRLEKEGHLSFLEFNYMILQAFDFYYLNKNYKCVMQIGGSEQWGNIVSGIDLIGKKNDTKDDIFGITMNLVTKSDGTKMGKSENGAIWLNSEKLPPFEYYQYFRNTQDPDVAKFLAIFTDLRKSEIDEIMSLQNINDAKKTLAFLTTKMCHGETEAKKAEERAVAEFENKTPTQKITVNLVNCNNILDLLISERLFDSKSQARQIITNGGISIDNQKISLDYKLQTGSFVLKVGKKSIFELVVD